MYILVGVVWLLAIPLSLAIDDSSNHTRCSLSNAEWSEMHDPDSTNYTQSHIQARAAGGIKTWRRPWPIMDWEHYGKLRVIEYCFHSLEDRAKLWCDLQKAIGLWQDHLGGPAGPQAGHNLGFNEYVDDDNNPLPCFTSWDESLHRGAWNTEIPLHVLDVKAEGFTAYSSVGYNVDEERIMRHYVRLPMPPVASEPGYDSAMRYWLQTAAHELGHAIGMLHEHQRPDRDLYIEWRCEKMMGYAELFAQYRQIGIPAQQARDLICHDVDKRATNAGIPTYNFLIPHIWKDGTTIPYDLESPYDIHSIMQYESEMGAPGQQCVRDEDCPMVQIVRDAQGNDVGRARIPFNWVPSSADVAFVKKYYPWVGWSPGYEPGGQYAGAGVQTRGRRSRGLDRNFSRGATRNATVLDQRHKRDGSTSYMYRVRHEDEVSSADTSMTVV